MGSLIIVRSKTTGDPNAVLMNKQHDNVEVINEEDFAALQRETGWTFNQSLHYIESVIQLPLMQPGNLAYTNIPHPRPYTSDIDISLDGIVYFDNSWTGYNWDIMRNMPNGGFPVFWTKDSEHKRDEYTLQYAEYKARFPDRGARIAYDTHRTYSQVFNALIRFMKRHPTGVRHVWIQGTMSTEDGGNLAPTAMRKKLQKDLTTLVSMRHRANIRYDPSFASYWEASLLYSDDLAFHYSARRPSRIPLIPWRVSNYGIKMYNHTLKPQLFPSTSFGKKLGIRDLIASGETYSNYSGYVKMIPMTDEDAALDFAWKKIDDNSFKMVLPPSILPERSDLTLHFVDGDSLVTWPKGKFWMTGDYGVHESRGNFLQHQYDVLTTHMLRDPLAVILFNAGTDFAEMFSDIIRGMVKISPDMIKTHMQSRIEEGNTTQPVDAAESIQGQREYEAIMRKNGDMILNSFDEIEMPGLYMAVSGAGKTTFIESKTSTHEDVLYKVEDPRMFMGLGSIVTSTHGIFAIGRDEESRFYQRMRRIDPNFIGEGLKGFDTSGHMMASVLAFRSQFLWYLQEIYNNFESESSIYLFPFAEPKGKLYHPIQDYINAISDMEKLTNANLYPMYARTNIEVCKAFVKAMSSV
jgi:hypothetical protein